jgi:aminomethyltransferase
MDIDQPHDFVGKSALKDIRDRGVTRRFMGLMIDGAPFQGTNEHWWDLTSDGAYAGYACASAYSPRAQSNIAVAMVKTDVIDRGAQVNVHTETGIRTADVVQLPII